MRAEAGSIGRKLRCCRRSPEDDVHFRPLSFWCLRAKFGEDRMRGGGDMGGHACKQTDRQTDRQTDSSSLYIEISAALLMATSQGNRPRS